MTRAVSQTYHRWYSDSGRGTGSFLQPSWAATSHVSFWDPPYWNMKTRICPGRYLANRNSRAFIAAVLSAYDVLPVEGETIPEPMPYTDFLVRWVYSLFMVFLPFSLVIDIFWLVADVRAIFGVNLDLEFNTRGYSITEVYYNIPLLPTNMCLWWRQVRLLQQKLNREESGGHFSTLFLSTPHLQGFTFVTHIRRT